MSRLRSESQYLAAAAALAMLAAVILTWPAPQSKDRAKALRVAGKLASLPLRFEENHGQTAAEVRFLSRGPGYTLFLTQQEAVLSLRHNQTSNVVRMKLAGASSAGDLRGEQQQSGKSHYFLGNDPKQWRSAIPHYGRVRRPAVYPGIDLVYYGAQGSLEYDFIVAPGADPRDIELEFRGQDSLSIDEKGDLLLALGPQPLRYEKPLIYQQQGGRRVEIAGRYEKRAAGRIGFEIAAGYDPARPLIIDPVLNFSTHLGDTDDETGFSIAIDAEGFTYIAGTTQSSQFPTTAGSLQPGFGGPEDDVFVAKLNAIGTALVFSTFLGANVDDRGRGIAVGPDGSVYVVGETGSAFPATGGAWQEHYSHGGRDGFLARISPNGGSLIYSTFVGSSDQDWVNDVVVDSQGQAYITGGTRSSQFPTTPLAAQTDFGGDTDAFVVKMNASGTAPVFSTFLGGGDDDEGLAITIDSFSTIYVTGYTRSDNFPSKNDPFQPQKDSAEDAFVVKIIGQGTALAYSSFFGGNGSDFGNDIAVDTLGNVYVAGFTQSNDLFRTPPVFQNEYNGGGDAFVIKVVESPRLHVEHRTYLGSDAEDTANGLAVWQDGSVTVTGHTKSANFPVTADAIQPQIGGGDGDAFVTTLGPLFRDPLVYSSFLGGDGRDEARDIAADSAGNIYITGVTRSSNFPVTNGALQPAKSEGDDAFVLKIAETLTVTSVSAASYDANAPVAPESIASAFAPELALGSEAATTRPLPSELLGIRVTVTDSAGFTRSAALFFVSQQQINFLVPAGTASGLATVEVFRDNQIIARGTVQVRPVAPSLFSINATGQGVAAGVAVVDRANGSRSTQTIYDPNQFPPNIQPIPVDIGTPADQAVIVIYGTGIRGAGGAANVTVTIGGEPQIVTFAGDQVEFSGLDQINVMVSPTLAGRGVVDIRLAAAGLTSNAVTIQIQ